MISESIIEGTRIRLRPLEERDLPTCVGWMQDHEVTRWLASVGDPPTMEEEVEWYERRRADPDSVMWAIEAEDGRLMQRRAAIDAIRAKG